MQDLIKVKKIVKEDGLSPTSSKLNKYNQQNGNQSKWELDKTTWFYLDNIIRETLIPTL